MNSRVGIIDIGSNSIRLVIYDVTSGGAYRVIQECKESARLSAKISPDGTMSREAVLTVVPVLQQFQEVCRLYGVSSVRTAATAAIRNAGNSGQIVDWLQEETGLTIEVLSGDQEGYAGFLGVINTMNLSDGAIIDIGGGSTEITLFRGRDRLRTYSFPFGAVNMNVRFGHSEGVPWTSEQIEALTRHVIQSLDEHDWIRANPGLPLVGLGGTIRTLGKINQKRSHYPLPVTHHYEMSREDVEHFFTTLPAMSYTQRKKTPGLSKDRVDIIIPGLIILRTIFQYMQATRYLISGSGLRDGLFYEQVNPETPVVRDPLAAGIDNILAFGPPVPPEHLQRVHGHARLLYNTLCEHVQPAERTLDERLLYTASRLYKMGATLNYYQYTQHSMYWILRSGLSGLSHRETVLAAAVADYHPKNRTPRLIHEYADILDDQDDVRIQRLGSLLKLAVALDRSETGTVEELAIQQKSGSLRLRLFSRAEPLIELREMEAAAKDMHKAWDITLSWEALPLSTN
ncbi:Ppx/GppA phosphatase family protein [Paenibacillus sp. JX-17]|uniref:Ppx/GppA phosphatase family protein n=1 Tax=Paenibacillus lacisoli TaxID=3064525 RepID=A0ABT9CCQ6_9BACL|nr:Ppx/GppA phosphatase family protein [Paenibacillus sp. JX-17]MDO7907053.1 Ppx/GppA phosphatase family protein [Paenibacillus sp. JX-17]